LKLHGEARLPFLFLSLSFLFGTAVREGRCSFFFLLRRTAVLFPLLAGTGRGLDCFCSLAEDFFFFFPWDHCVFTFPPLSPALHVDRRSPPLFSCPAEARGLPFFPWREGKKKPGFFFLWQARAGAPVLSNARLSFSPFSPAEAGVSPGLPANYSSPRISSRSLVPLFPDDGQNVFLFLFFFWGWGGGGWGGAGWAR